MTGTNLEHIYLVLIEAVQILGWRSPKICSGKLEKEGAVQRLVVANWRRVQTN